MCQMCKILNDKKEKVLHEDDYCKIVPTLNMKGHKKRIMIISKDHDCNENSSLARHLESVLISFSKGYFDEPTFAFVESTHATHPCHWHKIACDWNGTPREMIQLHFTPHRAILTNKGENYMLFFRCLSCKKDFEGGPQTISCTHCGSINVKIKGVKL